MSREAGRVWVSVSSRPNVGEDEVTARDSGAPFLLLVTTLARIPSGESEVQPTSLRRLMMAVASTFLGRGAYGFRCLYWKDAFPLAERWALLA